MEYSNIVCAKFISRPNRFCAVVNVDGKEVVCHVKNTGRCRELLTKDAVVFLEKSHNPSRKTQFDLVAVMKGERCVNIDSLSPNKAVKEWLEKGGLAENCDVIKAESTYKNSRFDFYVEKDNRRIFVEVKGVTLENEGVVMFPDAPTIRGVKHLNELMDCIKDGYEAYIIFVVQMKDVKYFTPNSQTHREFADTLKKCRQTGVNILCFDCEVAPDSMTIRNKVDVVL